MHLHILMSVSIAQSKETLPIERRRGSGLQNIQTGDYVLFPLLKSRFS